MRSLKGKEEKAMETHKRDFHDDSKRVTCTICQKEYPNLNMLKTHLRVHVVVEGKSSDNNYSSKCILEWDCPICGKHLSLKGHTAVTMKKKHLALHDDNNGQNLVTYPSM